MCKYLLSLLIRLGMAATLLLGAVACQRSAAEQAVATRGVPEPTASPTAPATPTPQPTFTTPPTATPTAKPSPTPTSPPTPTPRPLELPVRGVRLDFSSLARSRAEVVNLEERLLQANVNLVALGAGRLDWTYFKWAGHPDNWSNEVIDTGTDFLAEDSERFSRWARVDAVVDVFAPRYIAAHPQAAAISWLGQPSKHLVSTTELVYGDFGHQLLSMIEYIAANYPVSSISLTELSYYTEGYGDDDLALYTTYTGRKDWPRLRNGLVNIDHSSIGEWRSYEIGRFIERAAAVVHQYNKELLVDVEVSWGELDRESTEYGQNYATLLEHADRLVVWNYYGLSGYDPEYTAEIARYLSRYGPERVIISIGLWAEEGGVLSPEALQAGMESALDSEIPNLWITPSHYLTEAHWEVLRRLWAPNSEQ